MCSSHIGMSLGWYRVSEHSPLNRSKIFWHFLLWFIFSTLPPRKKSASLHFSMYTYKVSLYSAHIHTMLLAYLLSKRVVQDSGELCVQWRSIKTILRLYSPHKRAQLKQRRRGRCLAGIATYWPSSCAYSLILPSEFWLATEFGQKDTGNPTLFLPIR